MEQLDRQRVESLGPAERILQTLTTWSDHMVHNRPGVVVEDRRSPTGVRWVPATWKAEADGKVVYELVKGKKRTVHQQRLGLLRDDGTVWHAGQKVARWQAPGIFPEVATWLYRQVATVWQLDNEFAARWGSWQFTRDHRDLKVVLAAFLLVQDRCGAPVVEDGEVVFHDDDLRAVGEAMCLLRGGAAGLSPKLLLRVGDLLRLPGVAAINRELGFGRSTRSAATGRYEKVVTRWLRHRERNLPMLQGLVGAGYRTTVMKLARRVGYKPESPVFFEILRWKQKQADDGRRTVAIGAEVAAAETWHGLTELEICERIVADRPDFKRIVGRLPAEIGLTRAIVAAAVEAGSLSDTDLLVLTPTLEDLGLLAVPQLHARWKAATERVESQRAANVAKRVRKADTAAVLEQASEAVVKRAVEEVVRGLVVYCFVDISASMDGAIERAKPLLARFLHAFPADKLHVAVFNTVGRRLRIPHASSAGVSQAFRGIRPGGGTDYGAGVDALADCKPAADEDVLFLFVGDQQASRFARAVERSGLDPVAFGFVHVPGSMGSAMDAVTGTAGQLGVPCFELDEALFADAYAIPRTLRTLIASTPVKNATKTRGPSLVETILQTPLLETPAWARA